MTPNYDALTLPQKLEVFEHALNETTGRDLHKVLWLKSENSEVWLARRTNYTRSLAAMSMVGYILGLGDRHPSNLMIERASGRVLHIDFGDSFEIAMHRDKFPERVPFRLTRMLIKAMEASGIEGMYRSTCENVMRVLRDNNESVMTMLEAFLYDPLIEWRILKKQDSGDENDNEEAKPHDLNQRAVDIITRIRAKLSGLDFAAERRILLPMTPYSPLMSRSRCRGSFTKLHFIPIFARAIRAGARGGKNDIYFIYLTLFFCTLLDYFVLTFR